MNKELIYAYLAGILDGEGYVGIKRTTWGMRNRSDVKSPTFHERIQFRMCDKEPLDIMKQEFGGSFYKEKRVYQSKNGFKTNKIMYCYGATDKVAANIIEALLPYLRVKRRQAQILTQLRKSKDSKEAHLRGGRKQKRVMSNELLNYRQSLYQQIKDIHAV